MLKKQKNVNSRGWLAALAGVVVLIASISPLAAAPIVFPLYDHIFFQTSGPETPLDNGDWWAAQDYGNQPHHFQMIVPESADPDFVVTVQVYDPESYETNGDLDEMDKPKINGNGRWDYTYFQVVAPDGETLISDVSFPPDPITSETWQTIAEFPIRDYGPGIYTIWVSTEEDDENGYKLGVLDNDPDGQPHNGDEISLLAYRTSIQSNGPGEVILWFHVEENRERVNVWNFDMDGEESTWQYDITNPLGETVTGTISGEMEWNTGSLELPTSDGDEFINPVPGWWRINLYLGDLNQIIIYGPPYYDNWYALPHLTIDKDDGVTVVETGDIYTYRIRVTNTGRGISYNTRVTDTVPDGIEFVSASSGGVYSETTRTVTWALGELPSGSIVDLELTYQVVAGPGSTIENIARVCYEDEIGLDFPVLEDEDINTTPQEPGSIGDRVWLDENRNGLQDPGEVGLANVQVNLLDGEGSVIASQTTGADGLYSFSDLEPGIYQLEFILPPDYFFTAMNQGDDDTIDSDADSETGRTVQFALNWGDHPTIWDAGVQQKQVSDLQIEKIVSADNIKFGETFTYTIRAWNNGPHAAFNVEIYDDFPANLEFVSAVPAQNEGPNPLVWIVPVMEPGAEPFTIVLTARASDVSGAMDNHVFVSSENRDPNLDNNSAAAQVHVLVPIQLSSFSASWEQNAVILHWTTESETENMGFDLYRAETAEGEYIRLNDRMISGAGNSQVSQSYSYLDNKELVAGKTYFYKLADISFNGEVNYSQSISLQASSPKSYLLEQNYPNPFNLETRIKFALKDPGYVELDIYNTNGQHVRSLVTASLEAGSHTITWDGRDQDGNVVPTGTYLYSLRINNFEKMQKMILLK
ncbi:DUF11 domain-containing protein [candidate division KSB1 bacterium]|nr:DUF11 domain-containing protein [candidate division KSB1 bacterium]